MRIRGSRDYVLRVTHALDLLQTHVPDTYQLVQELVSSIVEAVPSGAWTNFIKWNYQALITLGTQTVSEAPERLAGTIAHEVWHLHRAAEHVKAHPDQLLPHDGKDEEEACVRYSYYAMRRLGVKEEQLTPVADVMSTCWWEVPFEERDW